MEGRLPVKIVHVWHEVDRNKILDVLKKYVSTDLENIKTYQITDNKKKYESCLFITFWKLNFNGKKGITIKFTFPDMRLKKKFRTVFRFSWSMLGEKFLNKNGEGFSRDDNEKINDMLNKYL